MAEMEKEGRPPENKRSRKPAHPVKREINEEMKVKKEGGWGVGGGGRVCAQLHVIARGNSGCKSVCVSVIRNMPHTQVQLAARFPEFDLGYSLFYVRIIITI